MLPESQAEQQARLCKRLFIVARGGAKLVAGLNSDAEMNFRCFALRLSLLAALAAAFSLTGCGLKGPLYLPSRPAPHKAAPEPAPSR